MIEIDVVTLGEHLGQELAVSDWMDVTQERIDRFAEAARRPASQNVSVHIP